MIAMIICIVSLVLAIIAGTIMVRWRRQARRGDSCLHCGYLLHPGKATDDPYERCSECGMSLIEAEQRHAVRCQFCGFIMLGLLAIALLAAQDMYRLSDLLRHVPDGTLIALAPVQPVTEGSGIIDRLLGPTHDELVSRVRDDKLSRKQLASLAERLLDRLHRDGELIATRPKWPRDIPIHVLPADDEPFGILGSVDFRIMTIDGRILFERLAGPRSHYARLGRTVQVPDDASENGVVRLVAQLVEFRPPYTELARREIVLPVELVDSWQDILTPIDVEFDMLFSEYDVVRALDRAVLDLSQGYPNDPDVTIAIVLELTSREDPISSSRYLYPHGGAKRHMLLPSVARPDVSSRRPNEQFSLRIHPDPELALRDFDRDTFWYGEPFTLPLPMPEHAKRLEIGPAEISDH